MHTTFVHSYLSFSITLIISFSLICLLICFRFCFQQIRNVFGAKSARSYGKNTGNNSKNINTSTSGSNNRSHSSSKITQIDEVNGQHTAALDPAASDLYLSQLENFITKHSTNAFDCRPNKCFKSKRVEQTERHHHHLPNNSEPKSQYRHFKRKCKRAVYKFMKGLFDERKLQKFTLHQQPEPIYFEVSQLFVLYIFHLWYDWDKTWRMCDIFCHGIGGLWMTALKHALLKYARLSLQISMKKITDVSLMDIHEPWYKRRKNIRKLQILIKVDL